MTREREDKIKKIARHYGYEAQSRQCIEEELVDVYIMILQMKYLHKISDSDFDNEIRRKLDRQLRRMSI